MGTALAVGCLVGGVAGAMPPRARTSHGTTSIAPHHVDSRAAKTLTCKTVPTSLVAADLGTSIVFTGAGWPHGPLSLFGHTVVVNGKTVVATQMACGYAHNPKDLSQIGVSISYLVEPSAAKSLALTRVMCQVMRPHSSNYSKPAIGRLACVQGHTGYMQSANGELSVSNVVVSLFGAQSPTQTVTLARGIAHLLAKAKDWTIASTPGQPTRGPVISVTTTQFVANNLRLPVGLSCARLKCSGEIRLQSDASAGSILLAESKYNMPAGSTMTFDVALTSSGTMFFGNSPGNQATVTLSVSVTGGQTVDRSVAVTYVEPTTTVATTPTTVVTTTSP